MSVNLLITDDLKRGTSVRNASGTNIASVR